MKIIAKKDRKLLLINTGNTQNENKAETIELTVPEEYEDYNKKIVFVTDDGIVWDIIQDNTYKLTKAITKYKQVDFYIWLTKGDVDFRSKTMPLRFYNNEDASDEITPEEIHGVNTVVNLLEEEIEKVENLNIEATKIGDTTTVTITKKDGTTESVEINDGVDGQDGQDAKINGKNSIEIEAGNNITIDNTENGIRINSTGGSGGTSNYNDLSNKPKINNVELSGNKSLNDLGIQPKGNYIEDNNYVHTDNNFNNTYKNKLEGLENYDDTEIKADISDIQDEQEEQNTDIENLQEENARLKATLPTTTGEGKEVTLNKTAELEFIKPPLPMGNSEQESTTGKNLIPTSLNKMKTINTTGTWNDNVYSNLGLSIKINNDLSIVINGTSTSSGTFLICNNETLTAGTYILNEINTINDNARLYIWDSSWNNIYSTTSSGTFTISEDKSIKVGINIGNGKTFNNFIVKPMISVNGGDYEPYTGGEASPNPQFESPITNVTGDVEVKIQNKNLWKIKNYSKTGWNIAIDNPLKGLLPGNYTLSTVNKYITANKGMTIYFSDIVNGSMNDKIGEVFVSYEFGNTQMSNTKSITQEQINAKYLIIGPQDILCTQEVLENMKITIEKGSTKSSYTPHKEQTFTFPLGNEKLMLGDYLADDGIHHVRRQGVLDGTETWTSSGYSDDTYLCAFSGKFEGYIKYDSRSLLCNTFAKGFYIDVNTKECIENSNYTVNLKILKSRLNEGTINGLKTWLTERYNNNMPVIVEYPLAQEQIVPYTSAQQEVYNQIKQALSYEEQTNISSNTIALFNVEAYQSTKLVLQDFATAIVALGGV